jgi:hypothetical protein
MSSSTQAATELRPDDIVLKIISLGLLGTTFITSVKKKKKLKLHVVAYNL